MNRKNPCVAVGKCVGGSCRWLATGTRKIRYVFSKSFQTMTVKAKIMTAKLCNLLKNVKNDGQFAHWEVKQRDNFAKLGEEVFRLKGSELNDVFKEEHIMEILSRIREGQTRVRNIKGAIRAQRGRIKEVILFEHALDELKSAETRRRLGALRVLKRLGRKEVIPDVVKLLEDHDPEVRDQAKEVIIKLIGLCVRPAASE